MSRPKVLGLMAAKTYAAEDRVFRRAASREGIATAFNVIRDECELRGMWVPVLDSKSKQWGIYWHPNDGMPYGRISLNKRCELWMALHELAHYLTRRIDRGHGAAWRDCYVDLVRSHYGDWYADRLDNALAHCVRHKIVNTAIAVT